MTGSATGSAKGGRGEISPSDHFARVERVFLAAAALPPHEREAHLLAACGDDELLRSEVEAMLEADTLEEDPIEAAVAGQAAAWREASHHRLVSEEETGGDERGDGSQSQDRDEYRGEQPGQRAGQRIGNYRLLEELGRGGMSVVYLAARSDDEFKYKVAIKLIGYGFLGAQLRHRLLAERQILADLQHPNIARLLDGGTTADGMPYFVMEYVDGQALDRYCDAHQLGVDERLRLFVKVCSAVHAAHRRLVVHRDLKPSNVLVDGDGEPKLLDFGIAKVLAEEDTGDGTGMIDPTRSLLRMGTPGYASPEQLRGEAVTTASDVYSLGVLLYRLMTGSRPFAQPSLNEASPGSSGSSAALLAATGAVAPTRPSLAAVGVDPAVAAARGETARGLARRLDGDLDNILLTCLRYEPERRYGSVQQLLEDLERHLSGHPVIARPATFRYRAAKFVRRNRWGTLFAAAAAALVVAFGVAMAVQSQRVARQRDRAEQVAGMLVELFEIAEPTVERGSTITARELLERGQEQLGRLEDQPRDQAMLRDTFAGLYERLGMFAEARELFRQAYEGRRQEHGPRHPEVAASLYNYGRATARGGDFAQAEILFTEALALRRQLFGDNHMDVAVSLNSLALVLHETGEFARAEPLYRQGIELSLRLSGESHPQTIKTRYNLALLLHDQGEYAEAEELFLAVLEDFSKNGDAEQLTEVRDLLGQTLLAAGKLEAAQEQLQTSLATRRQLYGDDHPLVARSANHVGDLLVARGRFAAAEQLIAEALATRRRLLGQGSAEVAESLLSLGGLRAEQGRTAEAEEAFRAAVKTYGESLSPRHPFTGRVLAEWGSMLAARGECARAAPLLADALAILPPADHRSPGARAAADRCASLG